ncbi:cadherin EGF LAG seven-pass G-type receptor fmi-1-like [Gigantopelta aegis]|uniref:cadherin EGF LAG seven-pass G-type receptor fmi-1-like n=1 Tax=Gigantopelta aegis TaxID=1735272 RepID=UPI001B8891A2|nr:cadherin EGF LAG seven-pass G-type receptor fmi-1-like [Gigantopelta aegis]
MELSNITDGLAALETFAIDSISGNLTSTRILDSDQSTGGTEYYDIVVKATDSSSNQKNVDGKLRLFLSNVNDNAPSFNQSVYRFQITCDNDLDNQTFGLKVVDEDTGDLHSFSIESNIYMSINSSTGVLTPLSRPGSVCDDVSWSVLLTVTATDDGSPLQTGECYVFLEFLPCSTDNSSTTDASSVTTTILSDSSSNTEAPTTTKTSQAAASTVADIEKWSLRMACGILLATVILMGSAYIIKYMWCSKSTNKPSVASSRPIRVAPKLATFPVKPTMSSASRVSSPSWSTASRIASPSWSRASRLASPAWSTPGSFPERSTQMTSVPSIESLHLV